MLAPLSTAARDQLNLVPCLPVLAAARALGCLGWAGLGWWWYLLVQASVGLAGAVSVAHTGVLLLSSEERRPRRYTEPGWQDVSGARYRFRAARYQVPGWRPVAGHVSRLSLPHPAPLSTLSTTADRKRHNSNCSIIALYRAWPGWDMCPHLLGRDYHVTFSQPSHSISSHNLIISVDTTIITINYAELSQMRIVF